MSYNDAVQYCAWKNKNDVHSSSLSVDPDLKSNILTFSITSSGSAPNEASGAAAVVGTELNEILEEVVGVFALGAAGAEGARAAEIEHTGDVHRELPDARNQELSLRSAQQDDDSEKSEAPTSISNDNRATLSPIQKKSASETLDQPTREEQIAEAQQLLSDFQKKGIPITSSELSELEDIWSQRHENYSNLLTEVSKKQSLDSDQEQKLHALVKASQAVLKALEAALNNSTINRTTRIEEINEKISSHTLMPSEEYQIIQALDQLTTRPEIFQTPRYYALKTLLEKQQAGRTDLRVANQERLEKKSLSEQAEKDLAITQEKYSSENLSKTELGRFAEGFQKVGSIINKGKDIPLAGVALSTIGNTTLLAGKMLEKINERMAEYKIIQAEQEHRFHKKEATQALEKKEEAVKTVVDLGETVEAGEKELLKQEQEETAVIAKHLPAQHGWKEQAWAEFAEIILISQGILNPLQDEITAFVEKTRNSRDWIIEKTATAWQKRLEQSLSEWENLKKKLSQETASLKNKSQKLSEELAQTREKLEGILTSEASSQEKMNQHQGCIKQTEEVGLKSENAHEAKNYENNLRNLPTARLKKLTDQYDETSLLRQNQEIATASITAAISNIERKYESLLALAKTRFHADQEELKQHWPPGRPYLEWPLPIDLEEISHLLAEVQQTYGPSLEQITEPLILLSEREAQGRANRYQAEQQIAQALQEQNQKETSLLTELPSPSTVDLQKKFLDPQKELMVWSQKQATLFFHSKNPNAARWEARREFELAKKEIQELEEKLCLKEKQKQLLEKKDFKKTDRETGSVMATESVMSSLSKNIRKYTPTIMSFGPRSQASEGSPAFTALAESKSLSTLLSEARTKKESAYQTWAPLMEAAEKERSKRTEILFEKNSYEKAWAQADQQALLIQQEQAIAKETRTIEAKLAASWDRNSECWKAQIMSQAKDDGTEKEKTSEKKFDQAVIERWNNFINFKKGIPKATPAQDIEEYIHILNEDLDKQEEEAKVPIRSVLIEKVVHYIHPPVYEAYAQKRAVRDAYDADAVAGAEKAWEERIRYREETFQGMEKNIGKRSFFSTTDTSSKKDPAQLKEIIKADKQAFEIFKKKKRQLESIENIWDSILKAHQQARWDKAHEAALEYDSQNSETHLSWKNLEESERRYYNNEVAKRNEKEKEQEQHLLRRKNVLNQKARLLDQEEQVLTQATSALSRLSGRKKTEAQKSLESRKEAYETAKENFLHDEKNYQQDEEEWIQEKTERADAFHWEGMSAEDQESFIRKKISFKKIERDREKIAEISRYLEDAVQARDGFIYLGLLYENSEYRHRPIWAYEQAIKAESEGQPEIADIYRQSVEIYKEQMLRENIKGEQWGEGDATRCYQAARILIDDENEKNALWACKQAIAARDAQKPEIEKIYRECASIYQKAAVFLIEGNEAKAESYCKAGAVLSGDDNYNRGAVWASQQALVARDAQKPKIEKTYSECANIYKKAAVFLMDGNETQAESYSKGARVLSGDDDRNKGAIWAYNKAAEAVAQNETDLAEAYHKHATFYEQQADAFMKEDKSAVERYRKALEIWDDGSAWELSFWGNVIWHPRVIKTYKEAAKATEANIVKFYRKSAKAVEEEVQAVIKGDEQTARRYQKAARIWGGNDSKYARGVIWAYNEAVKAIAQNKNDIAQFYQKCGEALEKEAEALIQGREKIAGVYANSADGYYQAAKAGRDRAIVEAYCESAKASKQQAMALADGNEIAAKAQEKIAELFAKSTRVYKNQRVVEVRGKRAEAYWDAAQAYIKAQEAEEIKNPQAVEIYHKLAQAYETQAMALDQGHTSTAELQGRIIVLYRKVAQAYQQEIQAVAENKNDIARVYHHIEVSYEAEVAALMLGDKTTAAAQEKSAEVYSEAVQAYIKAQEAAEAKNPQVAEIYHKLAQACEAYAEALTAQGEASSPDAKAKAEIEQKIAEAQKFELKALAEQEEAAAAAFKKCAQAYEKEAAALSSKSDGKMITLYHRAAELFGEQAQAHMRGDKTTAELQEKRAEIYDEAAQAYIKAQEAAETKNPQAAEVYRKLAQAYEAQAEDLQRFKETRRIREALGQGHRIIEALHRKIISAYQHAVEAIPEVAKAWCDYAKTCERKIALLVQANVLAGDDLNIVRLFYKKIERCNQKVDFFSKYWLQQFMQETPHLAQEDEHILTAYQRENKIAKAYDSCLDAYEKRARFLKQAEEQIAECDLQSSENNNQYKIIEFFHKAAKACEEQAEAWSRSAEALMQKQTNETILYKNRAIVFNELASTYQSAATTEKSGEDKLTALYCKSAEAFEKEAEAWKQNDERGARLYERAAKLLTYYNDSSSDSDLDEPRKAGAIWSHGYANIQGKNKNVSLAYQKHATADEEQAEALMAGKEKTAERYKQIGKSQRRKMRAWRKSSKKEQAGKDAIAHCYQLVADAHEQRANALEQEDWPAAKRCEQAVQALGNNDDDGNSSDLEVERLVSAIPLYRAADEEAAFRYRDVLYHSARARKCEAGALMRGDEISAQTYRELAWDQVRAAVLLADFFKNHAPSDEENVFPNTLKKLHLKRTQLQMQLELNAQNQERKAAREECLSMMQQEGMSGAVKKQRHIDFDEKEKEEDSMENIQKLIEANEAAIQAEEAKSKMRLTVQEHFEQMIQSGKMLFGALGREGMTSLTKKLQREWQQKRDAFLSYFWNLSRRDKTQENISLSIPLNYQRAAEARAHAITCEEASAEQHHFDRLADYWHQAAALSLKCSEEKHKARTDAFFSYLRSLSQPEKTQENISSRIPLHYQRAVKAMSDAIACESGSAEKDYFDRLANYCWQAGPSLTGSEEEHQADIWYERAAYALRGKIKSEEFSKSQEKEQAYQERAATTAAHVGAMMLSLKKSENSELQSHLQNGISCYEHSLEASEAHFMSQEDSRLTAMNQTEKFINAEQEQKNSHEELAAFWHLLGEAYRHTFECNPIFSEEIQEKVELLLQTTKKYQQSLSGKIVDAIDWQPVRAHLQEMLLELSPIWKIH